VYVVVEFRLVGFLPGVEDDVGIARVELAVALFVPGDDFKLLDTPD
jgi:hypothetical protein